MIESLFNVRILTYLRASTVQYSLLICIMHSVCVCVCVCVCAVWCTPNSHTYVVCKIPVKLYIYCTTTTHCCVEYAVYVDNTLCVGVCAVYGSLQSCSCPICVGGRWKVVPEACRVGKHKKKKKKSGRAWDSAARSLGLTKVSSTLRFTCLLHRYNIWPPEINPAWWH